MRASPALLFFVRLGRALLITVPIGAVAAYWLLRIAVAGASGVSYTPWLKPWVVPVPLFAALAGSILYPLVASAFDDD